jgi:CheY-like chemotaxis protein/DNA-directed RNA polymerase specialized sigma24 family protein
MTIAQAIEPHLSSLRRYARALSGSQTGGDGYVVALLEALVADVSMFPTGIPPKIGLYRLFSRLWNSVEVNAFCDERENSKALRSLQALTPKPRQALLLLSVEGFEPEEIADILEVSMPEVASLVAAADREIANLISPADILIIEDEPLTAFDLEDLVEGLGHHVIGIARTHEQALTLVQRRQPDLILSDIQLADGSTGIDAVNALLRNFDAPVIFVTGHAELLLSGKKPEPTFLIPKPYNPEMVRAVVGQALFFEVRSHIEPTAGEEAGVHAQSPAPTGTANLQRC